MHIIKVAKKGKSDVTIYLDNDSELFLTIEVFLKSGLKKGDEISDDRFSLLIEQNKLFHIKKKAFRLLGRRQHSASELRRKLWNRDYQQSLIDEVIEDLTKNGYLDDKNFVLEFIAEKSQRKNWSSKKIKAELLRRGISSNRIGQILTDQTQDFDYENALKLSKKKFEALLKRKLELKDLRDKLSTYLFSKGFEYDLIREVVSQTLKK